MCRVARLVKQGSCCPDDDEATSNLVLKRGKLIDQSLVFPLLARSMSRVSLFLQFADPQIPLGEDVPRGAKASGRHTRVESPMAERPSPGGLMKGGLYFFLRCEDQCPRDAGQGLARGCPRKVRFRPSADGPSVRCGEKPADWQGVWDGDEGRLEASPRSVCWVRAIEIAHSLCNIGHASLATPGAGLPDSR